MEIKCRFEQVARETEHMLGHTRGIISKLPDRQKFHSLNHVLGSMKYWKHSKIELVTIDITTKLLIDLNKTEKYRQFQKDQDVDKYKYHYLPPFDDMCPTCLNAATINSIVFGQPNIEILKARFKLEVEWSEYYNCYTQAFLPSYWEEVIALAESSPDKSLNLNLISAYIGATI